MKPKSQSCYQAFFASRHIKSSFAISLGISLSCFCVSTHADTVWTGSVNQDWNNASNWNNGVPVENGAQGTTFINTATGNFPSITSDGTYQGDWDLVIGGGSNGRLSQSAGTLATGEGNWMFLGWQGAQATYDQTGSANLKVGGFANPAGNLFIGLDNGTVSTWNVNTTGLAQAGGVFAGSNGAATGVINLDAGTVDVSGEMQVGASFWGNGGTGQLNMTGGAMTANIVSFARGGNGAAAISGTGVISGGTLNSRQWFTLGFAGSAANTATVTNNGGTINVNTSGGGLLEMGVFDATTNVFTVNSGSVNLQNNANISFGQGGNHTGTSTFTQNGGTVTFFSDGGSTAGGTGSVNLGNGGSSGTYAYNLNGGTLTTPSISKSGAGANGAFNFNGGTLRATTSTAIFMQGLSAANVQNGGAIIDTNGHNITIAQPLLDSGTGGLSKQGTGRLTLSGANTYDGGTAVSAGSLFVTGSLGNTAVTVGTGATIGGNGSLAGTLNFDTGSMLDVSGGTLTVAGLVSFDNFGFGNLIGFDVNTVADGTYTLMSGTNFDFTNVSNFGAGNALSLGGGRSAYFNSGSLQVVVIPEPGAALMGGLGMLALLRRRRIL
jgi:autotransporter-associated beta strand protein